MLYQDYMIVAMMTFIIESAVCSDISSDVLLVCSLLHPDMLFLPNMLEFTHTILSNK